MSIRKFQTNYCPNRNQIYDEIVYPILQAEWTRSEGMCKQKQVTHKPKQPNYNCF